MKKLILSVACATSLFVWGSAQAANPLINLDFNDLTAGTATNTGSLGGYATIYNNTNATPVTTAYTTGVSGTALNVKTISFGGTAPLISTSSVSGIVAQQTVASTDVSDFTISLWYQGASYAGYIQRLFVANTSPSATAAISLLSINGKFYLYINSTTTNSVSTSTLMSTTPQSAIDTEFADTTWKYLAVSFSSAGTSGTNSQATFYTGNTSGTLTTLGTYNYTSLLDPTAFTVYSLGNTVTATNYANSREFTGNMDNFQFYNSSLTSSDIQSLLVSQIPEVTTMLAIVAGCFILVVISAIRKAHGFQTPVSSLTHSTDHD